MEETKWRMPETTEWAKECNEHKPTLEYGREIHQLVKDWLQTKAKDQDYVGLEIGSAWGVSALAILTAGIKHLTSVDSDPSAKAPVEAVANRLGDRLDFINLSSDDFFLRNGEQFDLVYVDGSHLYDNVKADFFNGWECLRPGGLFIADDITHPANIRVDLNGKFSEYGVALAAWELVKEKQITKLGTTSRLLYTVKDAG